jgi:hypothetical protein
MIECVKFVGRNYKKMGLFFVLSSFVLLFSQKVVGMEVFDYESQVADPIEKLKKVGTDEQEKESVICELIRQELIDLVKEQTKKIQQEYIESVTAVLIGLLTRKEEYIGGERTVALSDVLKKEKEVMALKNLIIDFLAFRLTTLVEKQSKEVKEEYIKNITVALSEVLANEWHKEVKTEAIFAFGRYSLMDLVEKQQEEVQAKYIKDVTVALSGVLANEWHKEVKMEAILAFEQYFFMNLVEKQQEEVQAEYIKDVTSALSGVLAEEWELKWERVKEDAIWALTSKEQINLVQKQKKEVQKKYIEDVTVVLSGVLTRKI